MPLFFIRDLPYNTSLGLWKIEEKKEELLSRLVFSEDDWAFYHSITHEERARNFLASRSLVKRLLRTDDFVELKADDKGRPYFADRNLEISISHSYEYAACIISEKPAGIDIEKMKPKVERIAKKFVRDDEMEFIDSSTKMRQLYVIWCIKEALFKLHGQGRLNFKNHIQVKPFNYKERGIAQAEILKKGHERGYSLDYEEIDGYMMASVVEGG